jgi:predicted RNase H-like HicB family nuclease
MSQESPVNEAIIRLHIEPSAEGAYVATSPDVPGLVAEGRSVVEAVQVAQELARKIVESCIAHGDPFPAAFGAPDDVTTPLDLIVPVKVR